MIDLDDIADLVEMQKKHCVQVLMKSFDEDELLKTQVNAHGKGRPEVKYYLTLEQAQLFLMTGTTERCKTIRRFFARLLTLMTQFQKMQTECENTLTLVHELSKYIETNHIGKEGVYMAVDISQLTAKQIHLILGTRIFNDESNANAINTTAEKLVSKSVHMIEFYVCNSPKLCLENLAQVPELKNVLIPNSQYTGQVFDVVISDAATGDILLRYLNVLCADRKESTFNNVDIKLHVDLARYQLEIKRIELETVRLENERETKRLEVALKKTRQAKTPKEPKSDDVYGVKQFLQDCTKAKKDYNTSLCALHKHYLQTRLEEKKRMKKLAKVKHTSLPTLFQINAFAQVLYNMNYMIDHGYCHDRRTSQKRVLNLSFNDEILEKISEAAEAK